MATPHKTNTWDAAAVTSANVSARPASLESGDSPRLDSRRPPHLHQLLDLADADGSAYHQVLRRTQQVEQHRRDLGDAGLLHRGQGDVVVRGLPVASDAAP